MAKRRSRSSGKMIDVGYRYGSDAPVRESKNKIHYPSVSFRNFNVNGNNVGQNVEINARTKITGIREDEEGNHVDLEIRKVAIRSGKRFLRKKRRGKGNRYG